MENINGAANPGGSGNIASTPTSADACMSIVHSLMCHRQGGESEQFSKRAIESLVKKLKEKRDELDSLITAITTNGAHSTKCVTIPKTLDGRLQIAGRKCFPHVIYAKIWRWPDLHKNELRRSEECRYAFDLKVDSVCVNPYHYIRDVSLGVDLAALNLHQQQQMYAHAENPPDWNPHFPAPSGTWTGYDYGTAYVPQPHPGVPGHPPPPLPVPPLNGAVNPPPPSYPSSEIVYHHNPASWHHHQMARKVSTVCYEGNNEKSETKKNEENEKNPTWSNDQQTLSPMQRNSLDNLIPKNDNEPVSKAARPDHWCSVSYFELDALVGETFKASSRDCPLVQVDGYVEQNNKSRFCLGALSNVQRKEVSEITRLHIGKGVQLELEGEGDVWLHVLSRYAVYVQSPYLDWMQESIQAKKLGELVHKFPPNASYKVFDLRQCCRKMKEKVLSTQEIGNSSCGVPNGGHLAPALSHASAASGFGIDDLRKLCTIRVSFVKGFGPDYPKRRNITETPCWIQVQLHRGLQVLDEILHQMNSTSKAENISNSPPKLHENGNTRETPGLLTLCS